MIIILAAILAWLSYSLGHHLVHRWRGHPSRGYYLLYLWARFNGIIYIIMTRRWQSPFDDAKEGTMNVVLSNIKLKIYTFFLALRYLKAYGKILMDRHTI